MKVLLVDDTRTLPALIRVYLMGWDLEFVDARDGTEGLAKARSEKPDLVITDVRMPGMDGFELCAAIRADLSLGHVPVMLLTALHDEQSRSKGRRVGATAFLTKPVSVEELRRKVGELLRIPEKK